MDQFTTIFEQLSSMQDENELDTDHFANRIENQDTYIKTMKNYILEKEKNNIGLKQAFGKLDVRNKEIAQGYSKNLNVMEKTFMNANSTFNTAGDNEGAITILDQSKETSRLPTPGGGKNRSPSMLNTAEGKNKWYDKTPQNMNMTENSSNTRNVEVPRIDTNSAGNHEEEVPITSREQQETLRQNIRSSRRDKLQVSQRSLYSARQNAPDPGTQDQLQKMMASLQVPSLDKDEVKAIVQDELAEIKDQLEENKESTDINAEKLNQNMQLLEDCKQNLEEQSIALKEQIEGEVSDLQNYTNNKIEAALEEVQTDMERTRTEVNEMINANKIAIDANNKRVTEYSEVVETLKTQFETDYVEFIRDRKRWKSDFDQAANKAQSNFQAIEGIVKNCLVEQQICLKVLKMINDAQMISQLCERQDHEDKKQLGVFGVRTKKQQLNQALLPEHNAFKGPGKSMQSMAMEGGLAQSLNVQMNNQGTQEDDDINANFNPNDEDSQMNVDSPTKASIAAANALLPPGYTDKYDAMHTLTVDKNCLSCTKGQGVSAYLQQLKMACLSYTSSPITYRSQKYQQSELLRIKAEVISECQKALREHIYKTDARDGVHMRGLRDENSYVIEPLLNAKPAPTNEPRIESYRGTNNNASGNVQGGGATFDQGTGTDYAYLQRSMPPAIIGSGTQTRKVSPQQYHQPVLVNKFEMDSMSLSYSKKNRNEQINALRLHQTIDYNSRNQNYSSIEPHSSVNKDASQAQLTNFTNRKRSPLPSEVSRKHASMMARNEQRGPIVRDHILNQSKNNYLENTVWSSDLAPSINTSAHKQARRNVFNNARPSTQAHPLALGVSPVIGTNVPKLQHHNDIGSSVRAKHGVVFNSQNNKNAIFGHEKEYQGNHLGVMGVQEEFREPTSSVLSNTAEGPRNEKMKPVLYIGGKNITGV